MKWSLLLLTALLVSCVGVQETESVTMPDGARYDRATSYASLGGQGVLEYGRGLTHDHSGSFRDAVLAGAAVATGAISAGVSKAQEVTKRSLASEETARHAADQATIQHAASEETARAALELETAQ